jgi:hypothetical protein
MQLVHTIEQKDVGQGVYRHPMGHPMRALLVSIDRTFGGIGPKDVGVKVYRARDGQLVWGPALNYQIR